MSIRLSSAIRRPFSLSIFVSLKEVQAATRLFYGRLSTHLTPTRISICCGLGVLMLAFLALMGWMTGDIILSSLLPQQQYMVITTAIGFCLASGAIIYHGFASSGKSKVVDISVGIILVAIGLVVFTERAMGTSWIDFNQLHSTPGVTYKNLGQMEPNTAFCLVLLGLVLVLRELRSNIVPEVLIKPLIGLIAGLGAIGILSYWINLEFLYSFTQYRRMSFSTALAFVLCAAALSNWWQPKSAGESTRSIEPRQIYKTSDSLLILIVSLVALFSFAASQDRSEELMAAQMGQSAAEAREFFAKIIDLKLEAANASADRPLLVSQIRQLNVIHHDVQLTAQLLNLTQPYLSHGFSALAIEDVHHHELSVVGKFSEDPTMVVPLREGYLTELIWNNGYILRSVLPLRDENGTTFGFMRSEQPLSMLTSFQERANSKGLTNHMVVCGLKGDYRACFPFRWSKVPVTGYGYLDGKPLPMTRAVRGETATLITTDYRRERVMAAFGPIGQTGLGMNVKMDMWEQYMPVRNQFLKSLPFFALLVAASVFLMRFKLSPLINALDQSKRELTFLARHDTLTDLPNRALFNDRLERAIARYQRSSGHLGLLYIDIDYFKQINDTYGHQTGDDILRWFSACLVKSVRASDTVARLGGDEFSIILEDLNSVDDAIRIAQIIIWEVNNSTPPLPAADADSKITASIGIAIYPVNAMTIEEFIHQADLALYQSKQEGRNTYRVGLRQDL